MAEEIEITQSDKPNNGDVGQDEKRAFLEELSKQGHAWDGDTIGKQGMQMVSQSEARKAEWRFLIDLPDAELLYKDQPSLRVLTQELKRTNFKDKKERLAFLKYVRWCVKFNVSLDNAIRYLCSAVSEERASINDAIKLATHFGYTESRVNYNVKPKRNAKPNIT